MHAPVDSGCIRENQLLTSPFIRIHKMLMGSGLETLGGRGCVFFRRVARCRECGGESAPSLGIFRSWSSKDQTTRSGKLNCDAARFQLHVHYYIGECRFILLHLAPAGQEVRSTDPFWEVDLRTIVMRWVASTKRHR